MKNIVLILFMLIATYPLLACERKNDSSIEENTIPEVRNRKILIAYFSWGGTTQQVAENIARYSGGTLFRIETVNPYPTEYTPCTEVAKEELDKGIRPKLKAIVKDFDQYDTIFVGCPVWWHTAPMAVWSFLESDAYDFSGKTVIPFCTYQATYRDETLAKIVELTPNSKHLKGFGTTNKNTNLDSWLKEIGVQTVDK
ncbi:flavodoxin [Parabacteroides sp. AM08-6]|uniref:flavodoxin n=1 Tax=Parabacteroides sp. AM08-6 TaxID=2292053 RepID=UPI000EFE2F7D|nr:flavodoxin [Parabacteroides sp. AM08-6]RHJ82686.1 hypothetical protein DW103_08825 [Parabacteroides sp. AM08-6]